MRRHAKAPIAVLIAMLVLGASAAVALQTHKQGSDVGTPPDSGSFAGLAVAPSGDLFAADAGANRVDRFDSTGAFELTWGWGVVASGPDNVPTNEQQVVSVDATGGTFTLAYEGEPSADIAFDAGAAALQSALEAIPSLGAGNVSVTGSAGGPWTVEFTGAKADTDVSELSADPTNLTGGAQSASVSTSVQGASAFEVCDPNADTCRQGFAGNGKGQMSNPQDVATDSSGNVFVADTGNNRVLGFDASGALLSSFSGDGQLDGSGLPSPFSSFSSPCGVAVDQSNDNLFIADQGNNRIWIFDSSGAYLGKVADSALQGPCGLAFDSSNNLYVRNANDGKVLRFDRASATEYNFGGVFYSAEEGGASDVAIDTTTDHVYVDRGDRIAEYETSGSPVSTFGQGALCCSQAIAVDGANAKVYAADGSTLRTFSTAITILPEASTGPASEVTGESATISGTIDPAGGSPASCQFEYGTTESYGQTAPCTPAGPFSSAESVTASLSGLDPATTYHYRLHTSNSEGSANGADRSFTTNGPPLITKFFGTEKLFATEVGGSEATLTATIDPAGLDTSYRFQYTTQAEFEAKGFTGASEAPGEVDGSVSTPQAVSQMITGLTPATVYRFRAVAENAIGEATSASKAFRTFAPHTSPSPGSFPGQGFLPDNRAWELVSPPEKLGSDVNLTSTRIRIADDGSAVSFSSLGAFADALGGGVAVDYLANRTGQGGTNGWSTHATSPAQAPLSEAAVAALIDPRYYGEFSPNLNRGVFFARSPLTDDPNVAEVPNLYLRTDMRSAGKGNYELLSACPRCAETGKPLPASDFAGIDALAVGPQISPQVAAATPDLSKVAFESRQRLTSDTPEPPGACDPKGFGVFSCGFQAYVSDGNELDYVGRIPTFPATSCDDSGGPACEGAPISRLGQGVLGELTGNPEMISAPDVISDGSDGHTRVFFMFPTDDGQTPVFSESSFPGRGYAGNLYARIDNTQTVQLNASERTDCAGDPSCGGDGEPDPAPDSYVPVRYVGAAADGTRAFFTTEEALTDEAPIPSGEPGESEKLYMYDLSKPASDPHNLTLINVDSVPSDGYSFLNFIGASDDGRYVYFEADGDLLPGESTGGIKPSGEIYKAGIYLWHDGNLTYIGSGEKAARGANPTGGKFIGNPDNQAIAEPSNGPAMARVSADGKHLLFSSYHGEGLLSVRGGTDHECISNCRELYLYSADQDRLQCASCSPTGAATISNGGAADVVVKNIGRGSTRGDWHVTNALSDDGRYVFFSTTERLVTADRNGPCELDGVGVGRADIRILPNTELSTCTDAYVFDSATGEVRLLSSGESNSSSFFLEATPDGRNALIGTRERLSAWDVDGSLDVYDARIGGGFPEPPPPPPSCQGDACQPNPVALNDPTPASSSFNGPGNKEARKPHKRKRHANRKGKHHKQSKKQKKQGKHKRSANENGRASR